MILIITAAKWAHSKALDAIAFDLLSAAATTSSIDPANINIDYGSVYASMPVLRTIMLRDPFSWLISKFFWHGLHLAGTVCDDVDTATKNGGSPRMGYYSNGTISNAESVGWAHQFALVFLTYLCGQDCHLNALRGLSSIEQMERQAESNLRQSIAVVGILRNGLIESQLR
jgi:hypothetical protein